MKSTKPLVAKKPTSIFQRNVNFDLKSIFKSVTKGITHIATGNYEELGNDANEALVGFGLKITPEELAYQLIKRALYSAISELAQESLSHFELNANSELLELDPVLEAKLSEIKITLDKTFLEKPGKLKLLADVVPLFSMWLTSMGVTPHSSEAISKRLPSYFVYGLSDEWRKNASSYKPLIDILHTPFTVAEERERDWENYHAMLQRRTHENVFDEAFSLSQIYVPLRGSYVKAPSNNSEKDRFILNPERVVVDLEAELESWLKKADHDDAVRVLSGGPGSGKSSFTKMLCANLSEKKLAKPIYIPLHLIDPTREVGDEVARFVKDEGYLRFNPLDQEVQESNLLIVFDGLDELASQGKVAALVAKNFVQAVERMVERRNLGKNPISVLISGRELVIQENETEFRRPKQILTVLPYYIPASERQGYEDTKKLLERDDRNKWWAKYGILTGQEFNGLPKNLKRSEIDEITSQPLLNYLVALSFSRGKLNFDEKLNLNKIYADLVAAVYERGYEKRIHKPISHITTKEFERVLEEIGLAAWHASDGRSTSVNEILEHCKESGLEGLVATFQEGAKAGVTKLLAAFFFRKNGAQSSGEATFVFTHKSFGEYLTSVRIVRGIDGIVKQLQRRKENLDDGYDVVEGLVNWVKLVGRAKMTMYICQFLRQEIEQRTAEEIAKWQFHLADMLSRAVERGMPMEKVGSLNFYDALTQNNNASESLVIALNACARANKENIKLTFSTKTSFGTFLKRVCPQREGPQSPLLYTALSYFDFSEQCFDMVDFYGANLKNTIWVDSAIHYGTLVNSDLQDSNFDGARMSWIDFSNTSLARASMKNAICVESNFERADLRLADLTGADVTSSNIEKAILDQTTNLEATNFFNVDLKSLKRSKKIDLSKIVLSGEKFGHSRLRQRRNGELVLKKPLVEDVD
jgi:uncharacterized protein YjbI with pentapeptide repeats/predicted ATPase